MPGWEGFAKKPLHPLQHSLARAAWNSEEAMKVSADLHFSNTPSLVHQEASQVIVIGFDSAGVSTVPESSI